MPLSYLLLERAKWVLMPQFQPGRYLLFVTLFAMMLGCLAAVRAAERKTILRDLRILCCAIDGHRRRMGYGETSPVSSMRPDLCLGSAGYGCGNSAIAHVA